MRRRLVLVAAATTSMVVIAFLLPLATLVHTLAEERALASTRQVAAVLSPAIALGDVQLIETTAAVLEAGAAGTVGVVLADGTALGAPIDQVSLARARQGEAFTIDLEGERAIVTPVLSDAGLSVVEVRVSDAQLRAGVIESWAVLSVLGLLLIAGAVAVADRLARDVVRSTSEVAAAARRLTGGERASRAPVEGPEEIADVARALNELADEIAALLAAEREAAADLSHRLRTPLTALRLDVEALREHPDADRLAADVAALERAIDAQIRAARGDGRGSSTADLTAIARERLMFWGVLAEDEQRVLRGIVPDHAVTVPADPGEVAAALDALIGNVFQHTPAGTRCDLSVVTDGDVAIVEVCDDGPGLPSGDVLGRGVSAAGSTGLGLDICRRLAEATGGRLETATSAAGGACVRIALPLVPVT